MKTYQLQKIKVALECEGAAHYTKASYPLFYGRYAEVDYKGIRCRLNCNGEVKYLSGTRPEWPHPAEWLKRTPGNDWVYYSTGDYYNGVVDLFGEYYLPCPAYPSNTLFSESPFSRNGVTNALQEWESLVFHIRKLAGKGVERCSGRLQEFLARAAAASPEYLKQRAARLHRILAAKISVLPPDCRHVDYDVIPLVITDGCLYNCGFCEVKSGREQSSRSRKEIIAQLQALKEFFGPDLANYNSVFLGQHDALCARPEDILFAATAAYKVFDLAASYMQGPRLFLFGSAESFLRKENSFWQSLNRLPFYTHVNIGLESLDSATLDHIRKPVGAALMLEAFEKMRAVNRACGNVEVSANFLLGDDLPAGHLEKLAQVLVGTARQGSKGCLYMSPLKGSSKRKLLLDCFRTLKRKSPMETCLYLIQRL